MEIGKRAGVKRIVLVSSIGADEPFFPLNLLFGVRAWLGLHQTLGLYTAQRSGGPGNCATLRPPSLTLH